MGKIVIFPIEIEKIR